MFTRCPPTSSYTQLPQVFFSRHPSLSFPCSHLYSFLFQIYKLCCHKHLYNTRFIALSCLSSHFLSLPLQRDQPASVSAGGQLSTLKAHLNPWTSPLPLPPKLSALVATETSHLSTPSKTNRSRPPTTEQEPP